MNPKTPAKKVALKVLLVHTGSEFTWVPSDKLLQAGITVRKKDVAFRMANGQVITRDVGYAIIQTNGFETVDEVVFAQPGDLRLLGSRTLEGFGATVDARSKKACRGRTAARCSNGELIIRTSRMMGWSLRSLTHLT